MRLDFRQIRRCLIINKSNHRKIVTYFDEENQQKRDNQKALHLRRQLSTREFKYCNWNDNSNRKCRRDCKTPPSESFDFHAEWDHDQCDQIGRFFGLWTTFKKPLSTINLPKCLSFLGNFCKAVKIFNFTCEIIFGQLLQYLAIFYWSHWPWGAVGRQINLKIAITNKRSLGQIQ